MALLRERLEAELGDWQERLPDSWRSLFDGTALDFAACDPGATLDEGDAIWPQETNQGGAPGAHLFKAYRDLAPEDVRVVIFGNDPYTKITQATGRSFEQGDLSAWATDLPKPGRISPSLQSIICAAAASGPGAAGYELVDMMQASPAAGPGKQPVWRCHVELARAFRDGAIDPPPPGEIFGHWAKQGVLWLNRTLTYTKWLDAEQKDTHRASHQRLWAPFTERALELLADQARTRPIVVVLWGSSAADLAARLTALAAARHAPAGNVRTVATGHPQWPEYYFKVGNPLAQINQAIGADGPAIDWSGAGAGGGSEHA
jgi:uracil-DNA glycosylase